MKMIIATMTTLMLIPQFVPGASTTPPNQSLPWNKLQVPTYTNRLGVAMPSVPTLPMPATPVGAQTVGSFSHNGRTYSVDVAVAGRLATVWLRTRPDANTPGAFKYMVLEASRVKLSDAARFACRAKSAYDSGKGIAGCAATIGSGVCLVASVPSGGAAAVLCSGTIMYTADKGLADCVDMVSSAIAAKLKYEREWQNLQLQAAISSGQWGAAIEKAIDMACADMKNSK
jgi:hypothetical protein